MALKPKVLIPASSTVLKIVGAVEIRLTPQNTIYLIHGIRVVFPSLAGSRNVRFDGGYIPSPEVNEIVLGLLRAQMNVRRRQRLEAADDDVAFRYN